MDGSDRSCATREKSGGEIMVNSGLQQWVDQQRGALSARQGAGRDCVYGLSSQRLVDQLKNIGLPRTCRRLDDDILSITQQIHGILLPLIRDDQIDHRATINETDLLNLPGIGCLSCGNHGPRHFCLFSISLHLPLRSVAFESNDAKLKSQVFQIQRKARSQQRRRQMDKL